MKSVLLSLAVILLIGITGCASNTKMTNDNNIIARKIPPGNFRVNAQIIKIDSTLLNGSNNDPCSKAPCIAWVKVISIIGYGAGSGTVKNGDTLKTKFAFTLNPTSEETFPTLNQQLPGLNEGSSFIADFQLLPSDLSGVKKTNLFLVYGYKKTN